MRGKINRYNIDILKNTVDTEIREFINNSTYDYMPLPSVTLNNVPSEMFVNGTYQITWASTQSEVYKFVSLYFLKDINEPTTYENLITAYLPIEKNIFNWKVPYDFIPGNYYIKIVSSYENVEISDITQSIIRIISAKVPKLTILTPTGTTIFSRDNIRLMYTIANNQYGHMRDFSLYYVDKNASTDIISLNKTVQLPTTGDEYEDVTYFSIPWGVDDFRLIVSSSSTLDERDLSIYIPSVDGGSSSLFMHIDEPSILTYTAIGNNYSVTQNTAFNIEWIAKKGLDGLGDLVDVFYQSDRKKGLWELVHRDYKMSVDSITKGYFGKISDVKIPLTYMDTTSSVKIDWTNTKTGQKYEFKKDINVIKAQDTIIVSKFKLTHGYDIIESGDDIIVNDKLPIGVAFEIIDRDNQIEPGTVKLVYTISNSPDIEVKLMDLEVKSFDTIRGNLSEENVAKIGAISASKIKVKYYNRIFEKEQEQIVIDSVNFKMKEIRKHEILIDGFYNKSGKKTKKLFYNEPYILSGSLVGNYFDGVEYNIYDDSENPIAGPHTLTNNKPGSNFEWSFNMPEKVFTGSTSLDVTGYNTWNKVEVSKKYSIQIASRYAHITNKSYLENRTFYNINHIDERNYTSIEVNINVNLPANEWASVYLYDSAETQYEFSEVKRNLTWTFKLDRNSITNSGDYIIKVFVSDGAYSTRLADSVKIKINVIKLISIDFNKSSHSNLYKLHNTPYFYINDSISYLNTLVDTYNINSIDGISNVGDVKSSVDTFSDMWGNFKNNIYVAGEYTESSRISRIQKHRQNKNVFSKSSTMAKQNLIPILNKVLDKRKYKINDGNVDNILLSITNKFDKYDIDQADCRKRQIAFDDRILNGFINQLRIIYAVLNHTSILTLIRTGTIGEFASINAIQLEYIRNLYNVAEYYGHISGIEDIDPNRFTADYLYFNNIKNNSNFTSVLAIIFAFLYFDNKSGVFNVSDSSKFLNFDLLVKRNILSSMNESFPTCHDMLCQLYIIFPDIIRNTNDIINDWNRIIPSRNDNGERGVMLKPNPMGGLTSTFDVINSALPDNKYPVDSQYPFFYYLNHFFKIHNSNNLYIGDAVKMPNTETSLLKFDSIKMVIQPRESFKAKIKLNEYVDGNTFSGNTILYNDIMIYNNVTKYIYINDEIISVPGNTYSISVHESVTGEE